MKVLIVDDSITARVVLIQVIQKIEPSVEFFEAKNGKEAVEIFKKELPRVIFTDLTMPIMDGYDLISNIISMDNEAQIIVVTADTQTESKDKVIELGAKNAYAKPIMLDTMQKIFMHDLLI